ncbi:hypothetical protein [Bacillus sp. T33-2]|uniref:hypothetical protein n=1 Tax=Bacillus sp. T33-2 TaxID=2054168 RepID=UPI000C771F0A|nr:hypothetical protein [Bacillus sp. T33-2]PLR97380.1 hypothetical protein CVD19_07775 [Bacillus sp. T33-2]
MLLYKEIAGLFPNSRGIEDSSLQFHTVSCFADRPQPRGLFIPVFAHSGSLQEAIANGAVAALWQEGTPLPQYTPNHFPVFFTDDLLKGLKIIMEQYLKSLNINSAQSRTKFLFLDKERLNKTEKTYAIAVMAETINGTDGLNGKEGRG